MDLERRSQLDPAAGTVDRDKLVGLTLLGPPQIENARLPGLK